MEGEEGILGIGAMGRLGYVGMGSCEAEGDWLGSLGLIYGKGKNCSEGKGEEEGEY